MFNLDGFENKTEEYYRLVTKKKSNMSISILSIATLSQSNFAREGNVTVNYKVDDEFSGDKRLNYKDPVMKIQWAR